MSADDINFWANWALVGALALGVVATYAIVVSGNVKEAALRREVAAAGVIAETAKANAAATTERATALELEAANARERTAALEMKAAEARLALAQLEQKVQPRIITPEKMAQLIASLKESPKGPVIVRPKSFDAEPENFAKQVIEVLAAAGFDVIPWKEATLSWSMVGAFILIKDVKSPPPHVLPVQKAFQEAGFLLLAYPRDDVPPGTVVIAISTRL